MAYRDVILADGPTAYWRLGEGSGTTAVDEVGAVNGTYVGSPTLGESGALAGDANTSVLFDGTDDTVECDAAVAGGNAEFSFEIWAKSMTTANAVLFGEGRNSTTQPICVIHANYSSTTNLRFFYRNDSGTNATIFVPIGDWRDGEWHHWVGTVSSTTLTFYRDGVSVGSVARPAGSFTTDRLTIGALDYGGSTLFRYDGNIDEVAVYDKALTAAQVLAHYNAGLTKFGEASLLGDGALSAAATVASASIEGASSLSGAGSISAAGTRSVTAAASLSGAGTLDASATLTLPGSAALAGAGTATAAGLRSATGASSLTGAGSISADGLVVGAAIAGAASLAGSGSLSASGSATLSGASSLAGAGSLAADATRTAPGASSLSGVGSLTAAATRTTGGASSLTGVGSLVAGGGGASVGAASLSGAGNVVALGLRTTGGASSLSGAGSVSSAATRSAPGAAALAGAGSIAAETSVKASASVALFGTGGLIAAAIIVGGSARRFVTPGTAQGGTLSGKRYTG